MNKEQAEVFAAALRSGKYQQGKHYLQCNGRYCGLGVLLDVNGIQGKPDSDGVVSFTDDSGAVRCCLPRCQLKKVGLRDELGSIYNEYDGETIESLSGMNDRGASFDEIADFVLKNYERL